MWVGCGGGVEDVWPVDGGRKVRTMMDWSWPPGSADVPVGSHFEWVADRDVVGLRFNAACEVGLRDGGPMWVRP